VGQLRLVIILVIAALAQAVAFSQVAANSADPLWFDKGVIIDGVYTNQCLGFSFPIPAGWQRNAIPGRAEGRALHLPGGALALLMLHHGGMAQPLGDGISLMASDASKSSMAVQESVGAAMRNMVSGDPLRREMTRDAVAVKYGGRIFVRADYKQAFTDGPTQYGAYVYTIFRGYLMGGTMNAGSPDALNAAVDSLAQISFQEDVPSANCVMGPNDGPLVGMIGSVAHSGPPGAAPPRVRVSRTVSDGLLIKKVEAEYPPEARQQGVQGTVIVNAKIDEKGDVEEVNLVSGDAALAPAALSAVKEWKYKPYRLNGTPTKMETAVSVEFKLPAN
jgi:TonB family protein